MKIHGITLVGPVFYLLVLFVLTVVLSVTQARDLSTDRPKDPAEKVDPNNYRPCHDEMKYGVLRKSGDAFYEDGLKAEAAKCYETAVRIHTQDSFALFRLGNLARERNDLRVAAEWYMKAVVHRHNMSEAHNNLGITYSELGRPESALASFDRALTHQPTLADAHYNRANVLKDLGKVDDALLGYNKAVKMAPDNVQYYNNLALGLMAKGDYAGAVDMCDFCLRIDPTYSTAHYNLANALLEVGNLEGAVKSYQAAVKVRPDEAEYHHNLAFTYERMRKPKEAVHHLKKALSIKNNFVEAQCNLVDLLHGTADWRTVKKERRQLETIIDTELEADPTKPPVSLPRGMRCALHMPAKLLLELSQAQASHLERAVEMAEPFEHTATLHSRNSKAGDGPIPLRVGYVAAGYLGGAVVQHYAGALVSHSHHGHKNTAENHPGVSVIAFSTLGGGRNQETDKINRGTNSRWVDLGQHPVVEAAQKIRDERINIVVNLDAFSSGDRAAVLAMRPAAIQVGYRSHPGSLGAEWLDYSTADIISSPPSLSELFPEKQAYLPFGAVTNDYWRLRREHDLVPMRMGDREDYGLPEDRVILQNLGLYHRVDPMSWNSWMNAMNRLPNATLWLLRGTNEGENALSESMKEAGIEIEDNRDRVRFSDPVGREEHVRRSALGDVHLDTPMHSGHTMSMETLWSGTPVVTVGLTGAPTRAGTAALHYAMGPSGRDMDDCTGLGALSSMTRKEHEDLVVELAMKPPRKTKKKAKRLAMFDLSHWTSGGLNPLMQKHSAKGRTFVSGEKRV